MINKEIFDLIGIYFKRILSPKIWIINNYDNLIIVTLSTSCGVRFSIKFTSLNNIEIHYVDYLDNYNIDVNDIEVIDKFVKRFSDTPFSLAYKSNLLNIWK